MFGKSKTQQAQLILQNGAHAKIKMPSSFVPIDGQRYWFIFNGKEILVSYDARIDINGGLYIFKESTLPRP
ncbi:MAG TPA: hypothetical protein PLK76_03475 [bacterium]|mgnify:CR=1 FL=1|nr:hypothetical protein [bacterium]